MLVIRIKQNIRFHWRTGLQHGCEHRQQEESRVCDTSFLKVAGSRTDRISAGTALKLDIAEFSGEFAKRLVCAIGNEKDLELRRRVVGWWTDLAVAICTCGGACLWCMA